MTAPYAKYRVSLRAEVTVPTRPNPVGFPVTAFACQYAVNTIPRATLTIATGRKTSGVRSSIHGLLDGLRYKAAVRVYAEIQVDAELLVGAGKTNPHSFPAGEFLLFEGYTSDLGYARGVSQTGFTLTVEHWLSALTFSSAVSASSHPSNPFDLLFPATVQLLDPNTAPGRAAAGGLSGMGLAQAALGVDALEDLWGNGIYKWYGLLTDQDHLLDPAVGGQLGLVVGLDGNQYKPNAVAKFVLERMKPDPDEPTTPLALDLTDDSAATVANNIRQEIAARTIDAALAGQTLWDNLMELSAKYLFAVIPRTERAEVVPWMPGLRTPHLTVYADEYWNVERGAATPLQLRALALYGVFSFDGGGNLGAVDAPAALGVGGVYAVGNEQGVVKLEPTPSWLANVAQQAFTRVGGGQPADLVRNAGPNPADEAPAPPVEPKQAVDTLKAVLDRYAHAAYLSTALAFRTGVVAGKFRTDIAPGTAVRLQVTPEKFLGDDDLGKNLYATVVGVGLNLQSDPSPLAQTTLSLAHIRTEAENKLDQFTAEGHPLYTTVWRGMRLDND